MVIPVFCHVLTIAAIAVPDATGKVCRPGLYHGQAGTVFVFVGQTCPISNGYLPELNRIATDCRRRNVDFYFVCPDRDVAAHAAEYHLEATTLADGERRLVHALGPAVTPEAVVLDRADCVAYSGRIDDLYAALGRKRYRPTTHELRDAVDAVVAGRKPAVSAAKAIGCPIE